MQSSQDVSSQSVKLSTAIDSFHNIWITPFDLLVQNYFNEVPESYYPLYTRFKCLGPDLKDARKWKIDLLQKNNASNLTAQQNCFLALYYFEINHEKSITYATMAMKLGEKHAYEILGRLHWNSPDVTRPGNLKIAKDFFLKGAKLGCNIALGFLGDITIDPLENYAQAEKLHLKSANNKNPEAIFSLIIMYSMEDSNPELILQRLELSITAISLGSIDALNYVCDLCENNQLKMAKNMEDTFKFYQSIYPLQYKLKGDYHFSIEGSSIIDNSMHVLKLAKKHFDFFIELATKNNWGRVSPLIPSILAHPILNKLFAILLNVEESLHLPKTLIHIIKQYLMDESYIQKAYKTHSLHTQNNLSDQDNLTLEKKSNHKNLI